MIGSALALKCFVTLATLFAPSFVEILPINADTHKLLPEQNLSLASVQLPSAPETARGILESVINKGFTIGNREISEEESGAVTKILYRLYYEKGLFMEEGLRYPDSGPAHNIHLEQIDLANDKSFCSITFVSNYRYMDDFKYLRELVKGNIAGYYLQGDFIFLTRRMVLLLEDEYNDSEKLYKVYFIDSHYPGFINGGGIRRNKHTHIFGQLKDFFDSFH